MDKRMHMCDVNLVNLDSKGRLAMSTYHGEKLNEKSINLMICIIDIHQPYLLLYYLPTWKIIEQKLLRLSNVNPAECLLQWLLLCHTSECQMDSTGRILLTPALHHQHTLLPKEVMLVRQFNKFELWNEQIWYKRVKDDSNAEPSAELSLTDRLQDLSL